MATTDGPHEVLARFRRAAIHRSTDDLRLLYADDAVHEFPFTRPGLPSRLTGRDTIVEWIAAGWRTLPLRYEQYRTVAVHDTTDPRTVVVEQEAVGRNTVTGREFALPNLVVLTARDGRIARFRDYVNVLAAAEAIGA
ncbi:nuclear transport factor 2 family protein, partial [Actinocatenispora rupis]|uniref:nuclear transport factor 2 family protein n=1 Tax=Actinocatenispora rupis TaxID=519421 RepID=UPI001943C961